MARCNKSSYALLAFISRRPLSGYDMKQILAKTSSWYWAESNAQIYPILKAMEEAGCLTSKLCADSGKRERRVYTITPQGMEKLLHWLAQPVEFATYREEILLKISCGEHMSLETILGHLHSYQLEMQRQGQLLKEVKERIARHYKELKTYDYMMLTHEYGTMVNEAKQKWAAHAIKLVKEKKS